MSSPRPGSAPLGSAAEEAGRLFAAVEDWARTRTGGLFDGEHLATGAPECSVCPLCQAVSALRQVQPETVEHLLDAAASVLAALRSTLLGPPGGDGAAPDAGSRVEHIDVREG
ncbi:MAG: hypothetical protein KY451_03025 [Actinobacteria bacterium]|nr:hypothetical protein [Actinomycetota bacterium]MBW3648114.1 hypothetical protein [Actinomycetota bacterium]